MITIEQLNGEIAALSQETPTHVLMEKLANLYIVRDHMVIETNPVPVANVTEVISAVSDSEFMQKADGMRTSDFLIVMDELMTVLMTVNPRLYNGVMRNL